jgi:hypothetical protein
MDDQQLNNYITKLKKQKHCNQNLFIKGLVLVGAGD